MYGKKRENTLLAKYHTFGHIVLLKPSAYQLFNKTVETHGRFEAAEMRFQVLRSLAKDGTKMK